MQWGKYTNRLINAHKLIYSETTGTPREFAKKLHIGKSQLQVLLDEFKIIGAKIKYDSHKKTYYYMNDFRLFIDIHVLVEGKKNDIFHG
jgi:hypothetical protein